MNALWAQMAEVIQPVELRELILDLGISPADVPGTKNETVCLEFVYYMLRRRRIPELLEALSSRWPAVDWHTADILLAINNYNQPKENTNRHRLQNGMPKIRPKRNTGPIFCTRLQLV